MLEPVPPRLARHLLSRALPADSREHIVDDLDELWGRRVTTHGLTRSRLWYWREAFSFGGAFLRERFRLSGRSSGGEDMVGVPRIHEVVESVDPDLAVDELTTLEETWRPVRRSSRFFIIALAVVCGMALLLSLAGIYALMSFAVTQRVREIAIRAALGARPSRILFAVFSRALAQIGLGVLAGALLTSLTVVNTANGAKIVGIVAVLMLTVGLLACAVPAIRALRIDPADVLREA